MPDGGLPPGVELDPLQSRVPVKIESEDTAVAAILHTLPIDEDENATFNFRLSHPHNLPVGQDVRVYYGVNEAATSATEGEDYTLPEMNYITFSRSKATAQVTIPIINDKISEGDETLGLILLSSDHPDIEYLHMGGAETITIRDDDSVTVGIIGEIARTVNEGDGPVAVTFGITGSTLAANASVAVSYATSADTAFEADDYTPVAGAVLLMADNPEVTVWIPITNDTTPEGDERFTFVITDFGGVSSAEITITDDDQGVIGFQHPGAEDHEGNHRGTISFNIITDPPLADTFTLKYEISPGTAMADDYTSMTTGIFELSPRGQFGPITYHGRSIGIEDDTDPEELYENFFVHLSLPDDATLPLGYSLGRVTLEATIIDNDITLVGFGSDTTNFSESGDPNNNNNKLLSVGVGVGISEGIVAHTITLNYVVEAGSATYGEDYGDVASRRSTGERDTSNRIIYASTPGVGPTTGTITLFNSMGALVTLGDYDIAIPIMDDVLVENDETFIVRLFPPPDGLPPGVVLWRDTNVVTIANDDDVTIGFQETTYRVDEDAGSVEATIAVLTGSLADNTEITVRYSTSDDTAIAGQDYTAVSDVLTFTQSNIQQRISIPVINDDRYEVSNAERFLITISDISENPISGLTEAPAEAEVLIRDNDDLEITLRSETDQWIEGMAGTLRASIPDPLAVDLELTIVPVFDDMDPATVDADAGDYRGANTVTIPAGDRSVVIEASITDDNIVEVDKVLNVTVSQFNHIGLMNPHIYQLAARPSASITIVDDDPLTLNLEVQESNQEADTVQATVRFVTASSFEFTSRDRPQVVTLELRDANGELFTGRIDGQDIGGMGRQSYYGSPIPFTPQDLTTQDDITLYFENNFYEGQRAYTLELLKTPTQHPGIMLGTASADITVAENDLPELALNYGGTTEIAEGQTIDVDLELTNGGPEGLHEPLTVRLALTTTSSASTSDVSVPTSVTIGRGMSSATFQITARDDMLNNEGEQFELALASIVAPVLADGISGVVFNSGGAIAVTEVKLPQITLSASPASVAEGNSVRLTAMLTDPLITSVPEELTLELERDASSTADTNDYGALGNIVIPMNDNVGTVDLMIKADDLAEFAETLKIRVAQLGYGSDRNAPADEISVDLTITSDDTIMATITASDTNEGQMASVQIGLNLDLPTGVADNEVELVLVGTDRGNDVTGSSWNVGTALGSGRMATVMIPLVADMLLEGPEPVYLALEVSNRLKPLFANDGSAINAFDITDVFADLSVFEGEMLSFDLDATSLAGFQLTLAVAGPSAGFDFAEDIVSIKITQDSGGETTYTSLPANVQIAPSTRVITLTVEAREDILVETGEKFTLSATPAGGSAVTTEITLNDPIVEVGFSVTGMTSINEGETTNIAITLSRPLTQFLKDLPSNLDYIVSDPLPGSQYEDISSEGEEFEFKSPLTNPNLDFVRNLGFDFEFYGQVHQQVVVNTNGYLTFTDDDAKTADFKLEDNFADQLFSDGTTRNDLPIAAPFWADLDIRETSEIYDGMSVMYTALRGDAPNRRFIVQYANFEHIIDGNPRVTFQIVLFENGQIEFRYVAVGDNQNNVVIGITDGTGTNFEEIGIGKTNTDRIVQDNTRIVISPPRINAVTKQMGNDEVLASYDIRDNIAVGASSDMFTADHQNNHWDGDRTYTVELDSNIPLVVASGDIATYTVNDDDKPLVVLERSDGDSSAISIEEGSQIELVAKLMNAPGGAPENLVVNLVASGASSDFTYPASVTIPESQTQVLFMVTAKPDDDAEFEESMALKVTTLGYGGNTPTPDMPAEIDIMIPLNDKVEVTGITASDTNEGDVVTVRVSLNRALPANTANGAVMLVLDGTDRTNDVTGSSWDITSDLRSSNSAEVMITLTEDTILEGDEQVTLNLMVDAALDEIFPADDRGSGVSFDIIDDEDGTVSIDTPGTTTYSEAGSVMLTVELPTGVTAGAEITVNYEITFPTVGSTDPAESADFVSTSGVATIDAGDNSGLLTIALNDDVLLEETELFRVTLTSVSTTNGADVMVGGMPADLMILDDETLTYSFDDNGVYSEANAAYTVQLKRLGQLPGSGGGATVAFTTSGSGSSPASAADFDAGVFPSGSFVFTGYVADSAEVTLPAVKDDEDIEGDETLRITLTGRTETYDVTLADNDVPLIDIERVSSPGPVAEGASVQFRARLVNGTMSGATENLTVNLAVDPTDSVFAVDVSFPQSSVTIPMGMSETPFTVNVTNDELAEFTEIVRIQAESVVTTTLGKTTNAGKGYDLEISSDDMITVTSIEVDDTNEGAGPARVRITLSQPLPENVSSGALMLNLVNGERASDLSGLPDDVTDDLKRSSATQTPAPISTEVMIPLVDDMLLEGTELVSLWLQVVSPDLATLMTGANASFNIIDNEDGRIAITAPAKTMYQEGDTFDLTIALPTGVLASAPITVNYRIEFVDDDGNGNTRAEASAADITGGTVSGSATIPANQNSIPVTIDLNDDGDPEETELFKVYLDSVVADIPATRDPTARIISILDDEPLEYSFVGSGTVSEGNTAYTVQLRRLGRLPGGGDTTVAYTVSGIGSSMASAADFDGGVFPSGNFEFTNYNASAEITLTVADDNSLEAEETFRITAAGETLDVKLVDNESGDVGITPVSTTSPEDGDMVEFDVSLPAGVTADAPVVVSFEIITPPGVSVEIIDPLGLVTTVSASGLGTGFAQGLALPVRGFAQVARTYSIMIPAGQTSVRLTIQLTHDGSTEVREQLMVRLLSASTGPANMSLPVVVDSNTTGLANIMLSNFDVPDSFGDLPPTGGPVLPVWLILLLALTGVALLVPALKLNR